MRERMRRIWGDTCLWPLPGKRHKQRFQSKIPPSNPKYKYKKLDNTNTTNPNIPKHRKKRDPSFYPATSNARERLLLNLHGHEQQV